MPARVCCRQFVLVARITFLRRAPSARRASARCGPAPYAIAVSKKLIPRSMARATARLNLCALSCALGSHCPV
jgi:hypothetical protein